MNTARLLIDVIPWLAAASVVAVPFGSRRLQLVLVGLLFLCLVTVIAVGVRRHYRRDRADQ